MKALTKGLSKRVPTGSAPLQEYAEAGYGCIYSGLLQALWVVKDWENMLHIC
jgi:hypothetical protein